MEKSLLIIVVFYLLLDYIISVLPAPGQADEENFIIFGKAIDASGISSLLRDNERNVCL